MSTNGETKLLEKWMQKPKDFCEEAPRLGGPQHNREDPSSAARLTRLNRCTRMGAGAEDTAQLQLIRAIEHAHHFKNAFSASSEHAIRHNDSDCSTLFSSSALLAMQNSSHQPRCGCCALDAREFSLRPLRGALHFCTRVHVVRMSRVQRQLSRGYLCAGTFGTHSPPRSATCNIKTLE